MIDAVIQYFIDAYNINPLGQIIGAIAFIVSIINFAYGKDKSFIVWMMIASFFWGIHFLLIGALSAGYVQLFDIIKNACGLKFEKNKHLAGVFIAVYLMIGIYSYSGYISMIPILCAIGGVYLTFFVRGIWLNIGYLFIISLWFIYNIISGSIGGISSDIVLFFAGVYGIYKISLSNKKTGNTQL